MDSNILKTNSSYLSHLGKFLEPAVGYNSHWLLCWRATLHGWNAYQFHRRCDGKRDTVTIIKNGKYVFGGYTDIPWGKKIGITHRFWERSHLSTDAQKKVNRREGSSRLDEDVSISLYDYSITQDDSPRMTR